MDALVKEQRGTTCVEAHLVDYAHSPADATFVLYNAGCLDVQGKIASRLHMSHWVDGNKFILPFPHGTFDRVVVSPQIRNDAPVGDVLTGDDTKIPRMVQMLREAMRVLRSDGELVGYDQAGNIVSLWADLRDAGYDASVVDAHAKAGPIFFMKAKMFTLHCPKPQPATLRTTFAVTRSTTAGTTQMDVADDSPLLPPSGDVFHQATFERDPLPYRTRAVIIAVVQVIMFIAYLFAMVAVYEPLSIPTSIPMSTRLATLFVNSATGFPLAAYFARHRLLSQESAHSRISPTCCETASSLGVCVCRWVHARDHAHGAAWLPDAAGACQHGAQHEQPLHVWHCHFYHHWTITVQVA